MKNAQNIATPAVQYFDGKPYVRVVDLAHAWDSSTSNILAACKDHHVREEYLKRIDGRVWCELAGLRYRLTATKSEGRLTRHIREFLDAQAVKPTAPEPEPTRPEPEPAATDLGTAALIADARRTSSQAAAKAEDNEKRVENLEKHVDAVESVVKSAANIAEEASEAVDRIGSAAQQAAEQSADLARENANIISGEIERLTRLSDDVEKAKKKAAARHDDAMARIRTLEEYARGADWTLTAVAILGVVGCAIRLLRRR